MIIDGDPETAISLRQLVSEGPVIVFNQILRLQEEVWTFDLVLETPINRILFFPRQSGVDKRGIPNKQGSPRAYRLSIQNEAEEFLLEGSEPIPKRTLATLIEETKSNTKSRVDVSFPLQPARFIRLDLSLADQFYSMAEFQVYGEGVPTKVNYVSTAIPARRARQLRRDHLLLSLAPTRQGSGRARRRSRRRRPTALRDALWL